MAKRYSADALRFRQALVELSAALDAQEAHGRDVDSDCMTRDQAQCELHKGLIEAARERTKTLLAEKWGGR